MAAVPPTSRPSSKDEFEENFAIVKEVGSGRFGEVRMVEEKGSQRRYALKRTAFGSAGQPDRMKVEVAGRYSRYLRLSCHSHLVHYWIPLDKVPTISVNSGHETVPDHSIFAHESLALSQSAEPGE